MSDFQAHPSPPRRASISKRVRFDVFKRDGFACQYCGATPPTVVLELDHIHPFSKGGDNHPDNLLTACTPCNRGKSDVVLSLVPETVSQKAERLREAEEQLAGYNGVVKARRERRNADIFRVAVALTGGRQEVTQDEMNGLVRFIDRLGVERCMDAVNITHSVVRPETSPFRYFFGVCWNMVRELP